MNLLGRLGALSTPQKVVAAAIAVVVAAGGTAVGFALTSGSSTAAPVAAPTTTSTSATPSPVPTTAAPAPKPKPAPPPVNYLTGIGPPSKNSLIAVKINDTTRNQVAIDQADIVYVEEVEAGLTRLIALYQSKKPIVGPVRSVRASDIELLTQYGRIGFAASGGGGDSLPTLDRSILKSTINDRGGPGFFRDNGREAPYNLMLNLSQLGSLGAAAAKNVGWTWATKLPANVPVHPGSYLQTIVGGTPVSFRWNPALKRYVRFIDGVPQTAADGRPIATPNVVLLFCKGYVNYSDIDVVGNPGHYTKSVGVGSAVVFRNGVRVNATWSRPTAASGTTIKDVAGHVIPLSPGGAWVILTENGKPLTAR